jgi:hypothetical protein
MITPSSPAMGKAVGITAAHHPGMGHTDGWAQGPRLQRLGEPIRDHPIFAMFTPCCNPIAARNLRGVGAIRSRAAGCVAYRWEAVAKFGAAAGIMVEGVTLATHQFERHLGKLGY